MKRDEKKLALRLARESRMSGYFYIVRKTDFLVMTTDAAMVISLFADLENYAEDQASKEHIKWNGWIYCTVNTMENRIKIRRWVQSRVIQELVEKKFIITKLRGRPSKRYFRVNWIAIEYAIEEYDKKSKEGKYSMMTDEEAKEFINQVEND